ncbi:helix-turn-helix transcriptional regulator [Microtetraspora sp. AC03309]|uniref:XRE family transcriptional regulator n=1 Tax=Microtetraspora sp. AC03309 TaxID=2779376 RepID=UPI001E52648C|nr:XRE family transcriptional regulator [Microtetraspora sp. AC03309]MCC5577858.1 helix-turn-helix transcriptional regulator [Microtetraspora sp. AC03309]
MSGRQHRETEIARQVRARGLATGRGLALIADEIHVACGPKFGTTKIKAHRLSNGIALADVIEQVRALFERDGKSVPGIGETLLSAYESGLKKPGPEYLHYLCSVYRVEPAALGYEGPCICGHGHGMPGTVRGCDFEEGIPDTSPNVRELWIQPDGGSPSADGGEEDENVLRRTLLKLLAGTGGVTLNDQVLGAVENIRRHMDETMASASVSPGMLDQWEQTTTGFGRQYMNTPPLRLLCDVLLEYSTVRKAMERRQPVDVQERLCRMTAQLSGLCGMIMIDLGDHRMARSFFRTGRTAADETGDRALRAWVTAREALVPLYYGDPREALTLAKKSRDMAGQTPCAARTMAPVVEARALAMMAGSTGAKKDVVDQAKRALTRARSAFAQMSSNDQEDPAFGYTERQLYFYQGDVLVKLGQTLEADLILEQALGKYSGEDLLDQTLIRFDRAQCRLIEGEVEEALDMGRSAIEAIEREYRTELVMRPAYDLLKAVQAKYGESPALASFRECLLPAQLDMSEVATIAEQDRQQT